MNLRRIAIGVALANLVIRLTWVWFVHPTPVSDFRWYLTAATNLAAGEGYVWQTGGDPTAYWPVGWPALLSLLFRVTGPSLAAGLALQVLLSTATAVLVVVLAHRVTHSLPVAATAGLAYTVLPAGWAWDSLLGSEQAFTFLVVAMLCTLVAADRWWQFAAAGTVAGLACLVRPVLLPFPLVLLAVELLRRKGWLPALRHTAVFGAALVLCVAPWTVRNAVVMDAPIPVSTNGGVNLYQGVRSDTVYWWSRDPAVNELLAARDEVARNSLGTRLALAHWSAHPGQLLTRTPTRMAGLYADNANAYHWVSRPGGLSREAADGWERAADVGYWLVMAAAVAGLVAAVRRRIRAAWPLVCLVAFYSGLWMFFPAWDRFRYPLMPVFAVLAGMAALHLIHRRRPATAEVDPTPTTPGVPGNRPSFDLAA
ncbi:hypothetical protein K7640_17660 [Micromonospora sp. PLK6-60]|uniref:hypothetical protein n=1 Tax=Micromonospora sp. PLK6-60 TaxID=2873383 RepID=UPI001CA769E8|nr:hypothetical protein [Micromonospora sp. PLK6-60]MBY8873662.1 hypothetical protein [Micromonospora sp. PLK6-60]